MTHRSFISGTSVLLLALLAGCGSVPPGSAGHSPIRTSAEVPSASAGVAGSSTSPDIIATHTTTAADIGPLAVGNYGGGMVVAPISRHADQHWNIVELFDRASPAPKDLAHSDWDNGLINWVATTGNWVAWTDQSAEQGETSPKVLWRVYVLNLRSGAKQVLSSNGDEPDAFVPVIGAEDGYIFWTERETDGSAQELLWRPGDAVPHAVLRHTEMTPGSASITGGKLFFLGPNGRGLHGHTTGGDCWQVSLAGGTPVAVTHTALAMGCAARDGHLAWSQHIDPETPDPPADGIYDDPYSLWSIRMSSGAKPVEIHEGYNATIQPLVTAHAVVWREQSEKSLITEFDDPGHETLLTSRRPRRLAVGPENLCAYATLKHGHLNVTLSRLA